MKGVFIPALILLSATLGSAQVLPEAPKPNLDRTEWTLLAADAAVRGLDVYSTHWALKAGNKEGTLPDWIVEHPPVMALYSGSIMVAQYFVARHLFNHGHRRLAHLITAADVSITGTYAVHNLFLPVCVAPNVYLASGCQAPEPGVIYQ